MITEWRDEYQIVRRRDEGIPPYGYTNHLVRLTVRQITIYIFPI